MAESEWEEVEVRPPSKKSIRVRLIIDIEFAGPNDFKLWSDRNQPLFIGPGVIKNIEIQEEKIYHTMDGG
jgi:hypothetical protein